MASWRIEWSHPLGELKKQGYDGSERTVYRFLETLKQAQVKTVIEL